MKILFVTSEAFPLIKTGGLADVSGSLPIALRNLRHDVRLLLPGYREALARLDNPRKIADLLLPGKPHPIALLEGSLPDSRVKVWLLDYPPYYDRPGNPYLGAEGEPWPDNAERFALLNHAAVCLAQDQAGLNWQADIVHCNDWQAGLTPALLSLEARRPATVFTIHNLSYQGLFPSSTFSKLHLPSVLWSPEGVEFYDRLSFIKGGLLLADMITTVSPSYAQEIQGSEFGCGLEGLLSYRSARLQGVLNGVDYATWDPARDPYLKKTYNGRTLTDKRKNKLALLKEFGLPRPRKDTLLLGMVGRLVAQKGIDLVIDALPELMALPLQLVILGSGEKAFEKTLRDYAKKYPRRLAVQIGYDEGLSHRVEAGIDAFLMPSRFEPCGLNQMYSLRYGTLPIVRRVGGLADSVIEASPENLADKSANGIIFNHANITGLMWAVGRTLELYQDRPVWTAMMHSGMRQRFSWTDSARRYLDIYQQALHYKDTALTGV